MRFLLLLLVFSISCSQKIKNNPLVQEPTKCNYTRAVVTLNDSSIQAQVAKVDACKNTILSVSTDITEVIESGKNLGTSKILPDSYMKEAQDKINTLATSIKQYNPDNYQGVAIGVFRRASNAKSFVEKLNLDLGLNIQIITPLEEAILGFYSAMNRTGVEKEKLVAWHIDIESQQFLAYEGFTKFNITHSKVGIEDLTQHIQKKILRKNTFPFNLNSYQQKLAENYVEQNLLKPKPTKFKRSRGRRARKFDVDEYAPQKSKTPLIEILAKSDTKMIGVGPFLYEQTLKKIFANNTSNVITVAEIEQKIAEYSQNSNPDLTLLVLIKSSLEKANLKSVEIAEANYCEGLLLNSKYWGPLL